MLRCPRCGHERYLYIVSSGEYSDYSVDFLAVHERRFTLEEMNAILQEAKDEYIKKGYPTKDYGVDSFKMEEVFKLLLQSKGFQIVCAVGEFHLLSYGKLGDLHATGE